MKKFLFFVSVLFLSLCSFAQEVTTLTFTAKQQNQTYQKLDSVVVTNLSQNWTEVLMYPDTILMMNTVGITDWENARGNVKLYQNIPNPFHGITNFNLALAKKEKVDLVIYDLNGKKVAEYHNTLGAGDHTFRATMSTPQTYLLSSITKNGSTSIKMINLSNTGENARIEYVGSEPLAGDVIKKKTSNPFAPGDNMRYVGYATQNDGSHEVTVEKQQKESETITFAFQNEPVPAYLNVFTDTVTDLTTTTVKFNAHWQALDMTVKEEGFYYKAKSDETWQTLTCGHQEDVFSYSVQNLKPNTDYVVKAYALAEETPVFGEEVTFTTLEIVKPTIQIDSIGKINYTSATVYGSYVKGSEDFKKVGIELFQDNAWKGVASFRESQIVTPFSAAISSLKQGMKYPARAYIITASDTVYSEEKSFTTLEIQKPLVKTLEADDISFAEATLHGTYVKATEDIMDVGFTYKAVAAQDWDKSPADNKEYFSLKISNLTPATEYVYKAFAITKTSVAEGEEMKFTTAMPFLPTVLTKKVENITLTGASIGCEVLEDGGGEVTERGICYATTENPDIKAKVVTAGKGVGPFTVDLKELTAGTKYYVRAYAVNISGVAYGENVSFSTLSKAEKPTVITSEVKNILDVKATVVGNVSSIGGDEIIERGFYYSNTNAEPTAADKKVKDGKTGIGSFSATLSDLTKNTKYYVRAYAINSVGESYGEVLDFTTLNEIKDLIIVNESVADITRNSANVSAEIKNGSGITERGFIYSLYPGRVLESNPTYELINIIPDKSTDNGVMTLSLTDLIQGAVYYVRGYAKTEDTVVYSDDIKVVMQDPEGLVDCGKMVDADGNEYRTVLLGNTCWIRENLRTTKYADGTPITEYIPKVTANALPTNVTQYSRFVCSGDTLPMEVSGLYYGLGFINDTKAICPEGWHVSSLEDWHSMLNYVSEKYANNSPISWNESFKGRIGATELSTPLVIPHYYNTYAFGKKAENSNASGFGWFYAGSMNGNPTSSYQRCEARYDAYWTSTPIGSSCLPWFIQNAGANLQKYYETVCQLYGYFIRCVQDSDNPDDPEEQTCKASLSLNGGEWNEEESITIIATDKNGVENEIAKDRTMVAGLDLLFQMDGVMFTIIINAQDYDPKRLHLTFSVDGVGDFPSEEFLGNCSGESVIKFQYTCGDKEPVVIK